ncbi:MAG: FAD-dependent oxidoreductase, partial [Lentisphaeria bacterium]
MLTDELSACLKCKVPRCRMHCPVATPIPEVITLVQEGREEEAARMLFENNPLSAVCAIVCPHERNCCGHCIRGIKGQPVPFYRLEQEVSRRYLENYTPPEIARNPYRVAVVGAGPAGITMSIILSLNGFRVTLIDARNRIGGVLRYGIPEFRLPRAVIDHLGEVLHRLGVKFKPNIFIGSTITLDDMFIDGYSAIFIAVGTAKPNRLGLLGET